MYKKHNDALKIMKVITEYKLNFINARKLTRTNKVFYE